MKKFLQLNTKSFQDNGAISYKDLWDKASKEGYEGLSIDVATTMEKSADGKMFHAVFSSAIVDRHGEVVEQEFDLKGFKKNPVFIDSHNYDSIERIIGRIHNASVKDGRLQGDIEFAIKNPRGMLGQDLTEGGFLNTTSIGFIPLEFNQDGTRILKSELLEVSAVAVPANKDALLERIDKSVVPYKDLGNADEGTDWSGPSEMAACGDDLTKLKRICAWYDKENEDVKSSYKLPHHRASDEKQVWKGVSAAMAALLGARGGVDIPEGDKQGVYNHLKKHYADFGKEAPEMKEYSEAELKEMFEPAKKVAKKSDSERRREILTGMAKNLDKMNENNITFKKRKIFQGIREMLDNIG